MHTPRKALNRASSHVQLTFHLQVESWRATTIRARREHTHARAIISRHKSKDPSLGLEKLATMRMRKLCPNLEREDGLDTVLEVPIPEEMFISGNTRSSRTGCTNMLSWMRSHGDQRAPPSPLGRGSELQLMLGVVGAPLIPLPIQSQHSIKHIREDPIVSSLNIYIYTHTSCS